MPFALAAGLAEVAAGSIAMGLGGHLAARSNHERLREEREVIEHADWEREEGADMFLAYGLADAGIAPIVQALEQKPEAWVDFMMRFELGLGKPEPKRALWSALTIAGSYIVGGMIPLSPYFFERSVPAALSVSVGVTLLALFAFGYVKSQFTGASPVRGAFQTLAVGGLAAGAAFGIARLFSPS